MKVWRDAQTGGQGDVAASGVSLTLGGMLRLCGPDTGKCTGAGGEFPPANKRSRQRMFSSPTEDAGMEGSVKGRGQARPPSPRPAAGLGCFNAGSPRLWQRPVHQAAD